MATTRKSTSKSTTRSSRSGTAKATSARGKTTAKTTRAAAAKKPAAAKPAPAAAAKPAAPQTAVPPAPAVKLVASAESPATPSPAASADVTVVASNPVVAGPTLKKQDFLARVLAATDVKKRDAKPVFEAVLSEMGKALSDGQELQLPPLGKVIIQKRKDVSGGEVLTLRLRRTGASAGKS